MPKKSLFFSIFFLTILLVWELSSRTIPEMLFILPAPSDIAYALWEMRNRFWLHTSFTFKEMCGGFVLALLFAFPLAWTMMRYKTSRTVLQPIFIVIQCIPMFALAPIMVVWFGWSYTAIIIPTALMIFFPLTLNIYQGLKSTPQDLLEFFQSNQATNWQIFFKLRLPWAVPHIFAGFRISSAIAGVGAVAGEWAGAQNGLGILMLESRRNTDLEVTFGALFCLTLMSTLLYGFILYCEKISLPPREWTYPFTRSASSKTFSKRKRHLAFSIFSLSLIYFVLPSCSQQNNPTTPSSLSTRLLLDWLPNPNHIPLYVGIDRGFFREEGIDLMIQKMHEGGGGICYLTAQKADLLINHMPGTFKACSRGADLKIVGLLIKEPLSGLIYRKDPAVKQTSHLSGRVLGYCIGVPDTTFLDFVLKKGEIIPSKMKNVSVDLISAMGTHSVDFIYGGFWNIEPAQLSAVGVETDTFKIQDLGVPTYYEMILLANSGSPHGSKEFSTHFQKALQKSIDFCFENPEEAFSCYARFNQDRRQKTWEWQKAAWYLTLPLLAKDQSIDSEVVKSFYLWQLQEGVIQKKFDYLNLISNF